MLSGKLTKTQRKLSKLYGSLNPAFDSKWDWKNQKLLSNGDLLAESLEQLIQSAENTIELEIYIYQDDIFGKRIENLLSEASARGVNVRVSVDGVGSRGWVHTVGSRLAANGVKIRVYHQLAWERFFSKHSFWKKSKSLIALMKVINRRDHRKICIIDGKKAWISSSNIWDVCVPKIIGESGWKEVGIEVEGEGVRILQAAFNLIWYPRTEREIRKESVRLIRQSPRSYVRLNTDMRLRTLAYHSLLQKIRSARERIWITNPYFVPTNLFVSEISEAVKRGVDVKITSAEKSDIVFMPWVSASYQYTLSKNNVKMYAYFKSILHAKYLIIDDLAIIGSSNINHRSLHHDLEADIITKTPDIVEELARVYAEDLKFCHQLQPEHFTKRPVWEKIIGRFLLLFRNYL